MSSRQFGRHVMDWAYVVNLRRRTDRWSETLLEFERLGAGPPRQIIATDGATTSVPPRFRNGQGSERYRRAQHALCDSFWRAVKQAQADEARWALICEDDVAFAPDFWERFDAAARDLPEQANFVLLGHRHVRKPQPFSPNLSRPVYINAAHCWAISSAIYPVVIAELERSRMLKEWDQYWNVLWNRVQAFCVEPPLAYQRTSYSDIQGQTKRVRTVMPPWEREAHDARS